MNIQANVNNSAANAISDENILDVDSISLSFGGVKAIQDVSFNVKKGEVCLLYTSPSPRDQRGSRMPSSA